MAKDRAFQKLLRTGMMAAGAAGLYVWVVRPWLMKLGATEDELYSLLPGDELVPHPTWSFTHAVTIHTDPDGIWPWLVQWGYGRGGFYSYDWLDSLLGATGVRSAERVLVEYQQIKPGDTLPVAPGGQGLVVERVEEERYILLSNRLELKTMQPFSLKDPRPEEYINLSWLWYLQPVIGCRTRLISRVRVEMVVRPEQRFSLWVGEPLKPGSAFMDWGMLQGIKRRAEEAGCVANDQ